MDVVIFREFASSIMLHIKWFRNIRQVFFFAITHIDAQAYLCHVHTLLFLSVGCKFMKIVFGVVALSFILKNKRIK